MMAGARPIIGSIKNPYEVRGRRKRNVSTARGISEKYGVMKDQTRADDFLMPLGSNKDRKSSSPGR
jgi:hypothetical protein